MRVVRDGFAHIDRDGERLHTKVRFQISDDGRVAVFLSPREGPQHVYEPGTVNVTKQAANCSHPVCYGKASRQQLTALWEKSESAHV